MKIRIIFDNETCTVSSTGKESLYDLKRAIAKKYEIPTSSIVLRIGERRRVLELPDNIIIANTGFESGIKIYVDSVQPSKANTPKFDQVPDNNGLIMIRRIIPADNSCLFNSVAYAMEGGSRSLKKFLRQICASYIASDPEKYNEAFLGMPVEEYQEWILDSGNWGGAIETEILAEHYSIEICTIDTQSLCVSVFGSDKGYKERIYLAFDGVHYDIIVRNISEDMDEDTDISVFDSRDTYAYEGAFLVAKEMNYKSQITKPSYSLDSGVCSQKALSEKNLRGAIQQAEKFEMSC